jgi:hypothetical protein
MADSLEVRKLATSSTASLPSRRSALLDSVWDWDGTTDTDQDRGAQGFNNGQANGEIDLSNKG